MIKKIFFFSYFLSISLTYQVTNCPYNCNDIGICNVLNGTCRCPLSYLGEFCET